MRTELKHCTVIERRWDRNEVSRGSPGYYYHYDYYYCCYFVASVLQIAYAWQTRWLRRGHYAVIPSHWWRSSVELLVHSASTGSTTTADVSNTVNCTMHSSSTFGHLKLIRGYSETVSGEIIWLLPTGQKCTCQRNGKVEMLTVLLLEYLVSSFLKMICPIGIQNCV